MTKIMPMGINDKVWEHYVDVYSNLRRFDQSIDAYANRELKVTKGGLFVNSRLGHIKDGLFAVGFGKGKTLIDRGSGAGPVVQMANMYGGTGIGYENDLGMVKLSWKAFDELKNRGVSVPKNYQDAIRHADAMTSPINDTDVVWINTEIDKKLRTIEEFSSVAKRGARIIIYSSSPVVYSIAIHALSLKEINCGELSDHLLIAEKG